MKDEILEEIYEIRRQIAEECDYDMHKIGEYFMQWQKQHPEHLVREVPKTENITEEGHLI
ncbi:MAG: hypothetical protein JXB10_20095 [Pirellulales bacterium]|nr:hypothetical protein [Pirellulales bacterium]